ncbi:thiol:disulfide interchange protein [Stenotrophomonas panacihumi]|uniref:Thiol:disulfide interchange protein n=1 Tax=Stenotrophomonas panacihumi TaxID=676599 RepID=A0A0R0A589_9GAMM|nr:DsbE family thiol:disulfide interchange protein [Stenotrophomonas panacihumi]KRG40304.1 thiol:disulfide interchange protein [Stenotrophomonas panacihumi]PTN53472.1 DsbE family thiol:disulfide interchange protein [Stenotrophomonas panacihumi]
MSEPSTRRLSLPLLVGGVVLFLAVLALLLYGVQRSGLADRDSLPSALIGKPAPAFDLPLLHDPSIRVTAADLRGAPYVLNVWGSWCPTCREEHPILTRFALTKRVRVIGYNWKDERADALHWLEQLGNPYLLVLADPEGRTAIDWGIAAAPETFLIDAQGVVRWKYSGALTQDVIDEQLIPQLTQLERAPAGGGSSLHAAP